MDVAVGVGEADLLRLGAGQAGDVVGHDHVAVAHLLEGAQRLEHVHVALVGEHFHEVAEAALDVAEVDVEDLVALAEVADHVVDLRGRVLQRLREAAEAEVEAVAGALVEVDQLLEPVHHAQDAGHAAVLHAIADARVRGVACHLDAVLLGHRDDVAQPVVDPLPHGVLVGRAALELAERLVEPGQLEGGEFGPAATVARRRAQVAEQGDVVVDPAQPRGRRHAHRLAHALDLAVALGAGTEEDGAGFILQRRA